MSGVVDDTQRGANSLEIIEFYIDETLSDGSVYRSYFGMNVAKVIEIIRLPAFTEVPGSHHEAVLGTFNLREKVLPLIDLGTWLNKATVANETRKVIVTEFSGVIMAFIVSGVTRIHRMTWAQIEPPGRYLQAFSHDSVTGILRLDDKILFLLDMEFIIGTMDPNLKLEAKLVEGEGKQTGAGMHIFVVDDSSSVRNMITRCLEHESYTVTTAKSGMEAWEMLGKWKEEAAEKGVPVKSYLDLIISDIEMPEMNGHTLTEKIKSDPELSKIPVILFSAIISDVVRETGLKCGADDQIAKPDLPGLAVRTKTLIDKYAHK